MIQRREELSPPNLIMILYYTSIPIKNYCLNFNNKVFNFLYKKNQNKINIYQITHSLNFGSFMRKPHKQI